MVLDRAMAADFWGVVLCLYGDLFQGLSFWMRSWVCVQTLELQYAKGQERRDQSFKTIPSLLDLFLLKIPQQTKAWLDITFHKFSSHKAPNNLNVLDLSFISELIHTKGFSRRPGGKRKRKYKETFKF